MYFRILTVIVLVLSVSAKASKSKNGRIELSKPKLDSDRLDDMRACLTASKVSISNLIDQSSVEYPTLNYQWNTRFTIDPLAYFKVKSVTDIQSVLKCGVKLEQSVTVRGGGHSYEKHSLYSNTNIVLDMSSMINIEVDSKAMKAEIDAGCTLGRVYEKIWSVGKFGIPAGTCPTVGFSGHALGGGFGLTSRTWGLLLDNILGYEVVTADGKLIKADATTNSDLFWALRGAGSGNFGVVTKFRVKIYDGTKVHRRINLKYDFSEFEKIYDVYQKFAASNPDDAINTTMYICNGDDLSLTFLIHTETQEEGAQHYNHILKTFPKPKSDILHNWQSFRAMVFENTLYENIDEATLRNLKPQDYSQHHFKAKSSYITKLLNPVEISKFKNATLDMPGNSYILLDMMGGKVAAIKPDATAFFNRQKTNLLMAQVAVEGYTPDEGVLGEKWVNSFMERTENFMFSGYSYFNYVDSDLKEPLRKYYGTNLERLVKIKNKYDPTNFFNYNVSIPLSL